VHILGLSNDSENHIYPRKTTINSVPTKICKDSTLYGIYLVFSSHRVFKNSILANRYPDIQYFCGILKQHSKALEMIKNIAFIALIATRVFYQPSAITDNITPFTSSSPVPTTTITITPAKVTSINGNISNGKMLLQWTVSENENADQFEIEKSSDGKNFKMAALVFGTDKLETDNYVFFEKASTKKFVYRVKIINKNQTVSYSTGVEIQPAA